MSSKRTAIVTGASQGIGAAAVEALVNAGYNVVATSRTINQSLTASPSLVLVAGDIGKKDTATKVVAAAMESFGSVDLLVTNAGIFSTKPFTAFTTEDFNALVSTNLLGFLYITQLAVQADAQTKIRRCGEHHRGARRSADRGRERGGPDDHEGRTERSDQKPGD